MPIRILFVLGILACLCAGMPAYAFVIDYDTRADAAVFKEEARDLENTIIVSARVERGDTFTELGRKLLGLEGVSSTIGWIAVQDWLRKTARLNRRSVESLDTIRPGEIYLIPVTLAMLARSEKGGLWLRVQTAIDREQDSKVISSLEELRGAVSRLSTVLTQSIENFPRARTPEEIREAVREGVKSGLTRGPDLTVLVREIIFWILVILFCALIVGAIYWFIRNRRASRVETDRTLPEDEPVIRERTISERTPGTNRAYRETYVPPRAEEDEAVPYRNGERNGAYESLRTELDDLKAELRKEREWNRSHTPGFVLEKTVEDVTQKFVLVDYRLDSKGKPVRVFKSPYIEKGVGSEVYERSLASHMRKNDERIKAACRKAA